MLTRYGLSGLGLRAAAFLSGSAGLVFETLWFRQAGLLLGNAVWSSSIVLASFMAGLAIGNAVAGRWAVRLRRPLRAYAALELIVGSTGTALVASLPALTPLLVPALSATLMSPGRLNGLRMVLAFLLLVIPASTMGATLPILVRVLKRPDRTFGWTLGQLYGWNTLGAVVGALAGEPFLIAVLGVRGTALAALALNTAAASIAWLLDRAATPAAAEAPAARPPRRVASWAPLGAAFLAGAILLSLEVVWFRFLLLNVAGTTRTFAAMLAVILLGIAAGGLAASAWTRRRPDARHMLASLSLLAGVSTVLSYARFQDVLRPLGDRAMASMIGVFGLAVPLMLPTCLVSGLIFTLIGDAVRKEAADDARATGLVTLANTLGAMVGALLGGFVLLPGLGIEGSIYALALAYLGVAVGVLPVTRSGKALGGDRRLLAAGVALYALALIAFPFGLMGRRYFPAALSRWVDLKAPGTDVVSVRQGLTETAFCTRSSRFGTPISYRLITNAISMSKWDYSMSRYMRAFVYLPVALNPQARRALLIGYGIGVTAKALTDTESLRKIDVVEVSRGVVEATRSVYSAPGQHPLDDPRVSLHIEDGRFFLLTRAESYDIITAEPPPPASAGMWSLYSKEYFELLRGRLAEGGIVTYWLPAYQMPERDSKAITAAFCAAFPDCSLWSGSGLEWILLGTRNVRRVTEADFTRQWRDPSVRRTLEAFAFERPEHLGTTFLADAVTLAEWTKGVRPVEDDYPHRITPWIRPQDATPYLSLADPLGAKERFARSSFVRHLWPPDLRERTLAAFAEQSPVLRIGWMPYGIVATGVWDLHDVLTASSQRTAVLWLMGVDALLEEAARDARGRGLEEPEIDEILGVSAMADRDYRRAEAFFARAQPHAASPERLVMWRVLALCLDGNRTAAADIAGQAAVWLRIEDRRGWAWLTDTFGLPDAFGLAGVSQ